MLLSDLFIFQNSGPHFAAVNNNNEIIVTDFHNHSVKVSEISERRKNITAIQSLMVPKILINPSSIVVLTI